MGEGKESGTKEMRSTLSGFGQCNALFVDVVAMTGSFVCCVFLSFQGCQLGTGCPDNIFVA